MTSTPITVCFVAPKAYPLFNPAVRTTFGGSEVDLFFIATELAKDPGFQCRFIVADYGQPDEETRQNVLLLKGLDFTRHPLTRLGTLWQCLKKADADGYLIKTASPGVPVLAHFCRRHHRRFLYRTASEWECDGTYTRQHPILGRLFDRALRTADPVIVQNHTDREQLTRRLQPRLTAAPVVIANGHRLPEQPQQAPHAKRHILWVGRSSPVKQPGLFLDLAEQFPDRPFVMVCSHATDDPDYPRLCQRAAEINQRLGNLAFHQWLPFESMAAVFQQAAVLVNTSRSEGFPNTFIQAGIHAAAVVSLVVDPDRVLTDNQWGLCCRERGVSLQQALSDCLEENRYLSMGRHGHDYVRQYHDIADLIDRYKSLLRQ